jgi:ASC-1-like (ASCH) protein
MTHRVKTLQPYFNDVKVGHKTFELRMNDRDYQVGDVLLLEEWSKEHNYTGRVILKIVSYVLKNCPEFGLMDGYCILGLIDF